LKIVASDFGRARLVVMQLRVVESDEAHAVADALHEMIGSDDPDVLPALRALSREGELLLRREGVT
jgi:hypothetical protein